MRDYNYEKRLLAWARLSVRPHGATFLSFTGGGGYRDIYYFFISCKSVEKNVSVLLESDKIIGHFTRRPMHIYDNIPLNFSQHESYLRLFCTQNENTNFMLNAFSPEKRTLYE